MHEIPLPFDPLSTKEAAACSLPGTAKTTLLNVCSPERRALGLEPSHFFLQPLTQTLLLLRASPSVQERREPSKSEVTEELGLSSSLLASARVSRPGASSSLPQLHIENLIQVFGSVKMVTNL